MLSTSSDKVLYLSCQAQNLIYEIPMVYINGLALIETMEQNGVSAQTNFYTNPLLLTLKANNPLSGSVQVSLRYKVTVKLYKKFSVLAVLQVKKLKFMEPIWIEVVQ